MAKVEIDKAREMEDEGATYEEIAKEFKATKSAVFQLLKAKDEDELEHIIEAEAKKEAPPAKEQEGKDLDETGGAPKDKPPSKWECPTCDTDLVETEDGGQYCKSCGVVHY